VCATVIVSTIVSEIPTLHHGWSLTSNRSPFRCDVDNLSEFALLQTWEKVFAREERSLW
jgi:hypothetical protein